MLVFSKSNGSYLLSLDANKVSHEKAEEIRLFLKSIKLYGYNQWHITISKLMELVEWFTRLKWDYYFGFDPKELKFSVESETKIYRKRKYDPTVTNVTPFNFQLDLLSTAIKRNRVFIADEMGLGKSFQSIALLSQWFRDGIIDGAVLILKPMLMDHWKNEIDNHSAILNSDDIVFVDKNYEGMPFDSHKDKKIIFIANSIFARIIFSHFSGSNSKRKSLQRVSWEKNPIDILGRWGKSSMALLIDECHHFKNTSAIKYKALLPHLHNFDYRILTSATPATDGVEDWWAQLNILDPGIVGVPENVFKLSLSLNIGSKYDPYKIKDYDSKVVKSFLDSIKNIVYRRKKKNLPEVKTNRLVKCINITMSPLHQEIYYTVKESMLYKIDSDSFHSDPFEIFNKYPFIVQVIDNPSLLKNKLHSTDTGSLQPINGLINRWSDKYDNKMQYLSEYLKEHVETNKEKVIVYDYHPYTLDYLSTKFRKYGTVAIHGKINSRLVSDDLEKFLDPNSNIKVAFLSMLSMGEGLNLNKGGCNRIIYFNLCDNSVKVQQSMDRTDRINSTEDTQIEILVYNQSVDMIRYNSVIGKIRFDNISFNNSITAREIDRFMSNSRKIANG